MFGASLSWFLCCTLRSLNIQLAMLFSSAATTQHTHQLLVYVSWSSSDSQSCAQRQPSVALSVSSQLLGWWQSGIRLDLRHSVSSSLIFILWQEPQASAPVLVDSRAGFLVCWSTFAPRFALHDLFVQQWALPSIEHVGYVLLIE